jgi:pyridoxamine 5'-phosphate oxidase
LTGGVDALADLRDEYRRSRLDEADVDPDPLVQLRAWLGDAITAAALEPTAMVLATVGPDGQPSTRTVLCKGVDERGLRFFTNRSSRKGTELAAHPSCAVTFHWRELERQVGVTGHAEPLPDDESDAYFATRPRGSQLGAWASAQSAVVADRAALDASLATVAARWPEGTRVPRPPGWGGYLVVPQTLELWQGRPSRLHDRVRYTRVPGSGGSDTWRTERLAP